MGPGGLGENVLTAALDLLGLPQGSVLTFGEPQDAAAVEITGLRNPCRQIDRFRPGLLQVALDRAADGSVVRRAGIMGVVIRSGAVRPGMPIDIRLPAGPHRPLAPV